MGDFLTDELKKGDYIEEFVSGGPKNYGYRSKTGKKECKVRGFTLNYRNAEVINFETMKNVVVTPEESTLKITNPSKIC